MKLLDFFDSYVSMGLKPIPIYTQSKMPICKGWHHDWSPSKWRSYFETDNYNMGIILGDIVDVEGDSPEANRLLNKLIGDYPHPKFSSSKSIHHLFKTPNVNLTRVAYHGIEFRGKNHQSVVPPSMHGDNLRYRWVDGSIFEIPEMPKNLLNYFIKVCSIKSKKIDSKTINQLYTTICKSCNQKVKIHKKRLALEVQAFDYHGLPWACQKCRKIDIRPLCRKIKWKKVK